MKLLLVAFSLILLTATKNCGNKKTSLAKGCYRGKLQIKAACMNYTIGLTGGDLDSSLMQETWTDETTGKTYWNVFALGSRCTFPATIQEGDEFYFTIDSSSAQNCAVCMIYYPVPRKHLFIKVLSEPCTQP